MSIEQSQGRRRNVDTLTILEEIQVKSASIIEDSSFNEERWTDLPGSRVFLANWVSPIDGINFQLQADGKRMNPNEVQFEYLLRGYKTQITNPEITFKYNSFKLEVLKLNPEGKYKRCSKDDVDMLHGCLASFGTELTEKEIDDFLGSMQANEIVDPRLRADMKRTLARLLPGWLNK